MSEPRARRVRVQVRSVQVMDGARDETKLCASGMLLETAAGVRVTYSHKDDGTPLRTTVQTVGQNPVTVTHRGGVWTLRAARCGFRMRCFLPHSPQSTII